jgi:hypothetical protein
MSKFVRSSKFRHVFGAPAKKENCYDGIKPSRSAWDSNKVCASTKFIACIWDASGGGAFCVLDINNKGKLGQFPLVAGHSGEVLDIDFNPFHDSIIASVSDDCYGKIWHIPEGGLKETMTTPVQNLAGHKRKVGTVTWNPVANNVLATTSNDFQVKVWDVEKGDTICDVSGHAELIQCAGWNWNGSLMCTAAKDKKIRVVDPRSNSIVQEAEAHAGVKGMRAAFLGDKEKLFSMGFSKTSERQFSLWDPRSLKDPLHSENIDTAAGIIMPFYDNDTSVLFLAGKGDGNIRYYELVDEAPFIYFLTEFKSGTPQRGMGVMPKLGMDLQSCEIARLFKLTASAIEPISFTVPRKSDIFQDDLYPPTYAGEAALSASEWVSGSNADPKMTTLNPGFVRKAPASEFKAVLKEEPTGPKNEAELRAEWEKLKARVAFLEAEIVKKDAKIKELGGQ